MAWPPLAPLLSPLCMAMLAHYTEGNGDIHTVEYLAPVLARLYFRRQLQGARLSSHQEVGTF